MERVCFSEFPLMNRVYQCLESETRDALSFYLCSCECLGIEASKKTATRFIHN